MTTTALQSQQLQWLVSKSEQCSMKGSDLWGANLEKAYVLNANLKEADLRGANLKWAGSSKVDLAGFNLERPNAWGVNLVRAIYDHDTFWPDDFDCKNSGAIDSTLLGYEQFKQWREKRDKSQ